MLQTILLLLKRHKVMPAFCRMSSDAPSDGVLGQDDGAPLSLPELLLVLPLGQVVWAFWMLQGLAAWVPLKECHHSVIQ